MCWYESFLSQVSGKWFVDSWNVMTVDDLMLPRDSYLDCRIFQLCKKLFGKMKIGRQQEFWRIATFNDSEILTKSRFPAFKELRIARKLIISILKGSFLLKIHARASPMRIYSLSCYEHKFNKTRRTHSLSPWRIAHLRGCEFIPRHPVVREWRGIGMFPLMDRATKLNMIKMKSKKTHTSWQHAMRTRTSLQIEESARERDASTPRKKARCRFPVFQSTILPILLSRSRVSVTKAEQQNTKREQYQKHNTKMWASNLSWLSRANISLSKITATNPRRAFFELPRTKTETIRSDWQERVIRPGSNLKCLRRQTVQTVTGCLLGILAISQKWALYLD